MKLKDGGIMAFVTSAGTLDKKDENARKMLAENADLIGAVRLPSGAFKANAGTEVTSDVIFLQKRSEPLQEIPDWVHIGKTENGLPVNQYFADHPEMILGTIVEDTNPRSSGTKVIADEEKPLRDQLSEAVKKLSATISDKRAKSVYAETKDIKVQIPEKLHVFSLFESPDNGNIYMKLADNTVDFKYDRENSQHRRAKAFIELRDCTRELLTTQETDKPASVITALQQKLNTIYDDFYKKFGLLHSKTNKRCFSEDMSYRLVCSLEKSYEKDILKEKGDIFTKRTIKHSEAVTHTDTAIDALALSVAERAKVDFEYMQQLTDMSKEQLIDELKGEIFLVPGADTYQTASEYLSGDIRVKLDAAEKYAENDSRYTENVEALKQVMPEPLKASEIDVKIGATWIDPKYYEQFMYETFNTPEEQRKGSRGFFWQKPKRIEVEYSELANAFNITNSRSDKSVASTKKFGTKDLTAYEIMESLLNLKDPKVTMLVPDPNDPYKEKRVVDIEATKIAQQKAEKIRETFSEWIFAAPERREEIAAVYNAKFNSIVPQEFDGSHLMFPKMNADITLKSHQKDAVAHALFGGNTLFAHSVGAGKTFEMIAASMESKRLGLSTKTLMCVPNHLTEQIGEDFLKLYPSANILVATKQDFQKEKRQELFSKIATGDYDAVIIGHSQLKMIPMSKKRQEEFLQAQIDDISESIKEYKRGKDGSDWSVKAMERSKKSLQTQLDKLAVKKQDDVVTFEEMGIDKLIVDEAHEFKNLFTPTKLQNISGISTSASQKAQDLFQKCRFLDEKTGGKGVILATGTPLSNSVTELHTMMRYLEYDFLKSKGLEHFDNWVAVFGEQKTDWELAPAGNKFKQRTRIAHYTGLPELMSMFKQVADIKTADMMKLDVPNCETHIVNVDATEFQQKLVAELADRADDVQSGKVLPTVDNMLKITSDGRKLGLDPRLIDPTFEDDPSTKLNRCVENVAKIHAETADERLTQIIFCDLGVPHKSSSSEKADDDEKSISERESFEEECDFCVYDDIRDKLIAKGVPKEEIAYIHDAKNEKQKSELFEKVRSGDIRVLIGSTSKMGTGTNVQDKLIAVHDLDIPWRPADLEQRAGRIVRQGNQNKNVHIYRYVTKSTFDAYSYQTLEMNCSPFVRQCGII